MANHVCLINKSTAKTSIGLHNGDIIAIRNRYYLVTSIATHEKEKISIKEKARLCALISMSSGNRMFSFGIDRNITQQCLSIEINKILAAIRNSHIHKDNPEFSPITAKDICVIRKNEYNIIIEKL